MSEQIFGMELKKTKNSWKSKWSPYLKSVRILRNGYSVNTRALPRRMFSILDRFCKPLFPLTYFLKKALPSILMPSASADIWDYTNKLDVLSFFVNHPQTTLSNRTIYKSKQTYNAMHSWWRFIWNRANLLALLRVEAIPTNSLCAVGKTHPTKHLNAFRCRLPVEMFENNLNSTSGRPCQRDVLRRVWHSGCP